MNIERLNKAIELRHELHRHPELSGQEVWSKQHLMDFVADNTNLEICDKGSYFYAVYRTSAENKRPGIALRADFDALPIEDEIDKPYRSEIPGIGHKCGHDGHAATLCALATELEEMAPDRDVFLIFQHGEETGIGGILAKDAIVENADDISETYAFHNEPGFPKDAVVIRSNTSNCASTGMTIHFLGTPAHASTPEFGKNPSFAIASIISSIPELIEPSKYKGLTLCTIVQIDVGERAFGVSASEGYLRMTIRGEFEEEMEILRASLIKIAEEEAAKYGLSVDFSYEDSFPVTQNDREHVEKVCQAAKALGLEAIVTDIPDRGSEDYGYFLKEKPGAYFLIGVGEDHPTYHTSAFDFDDSIMDEAVEMFKELIRM